MAAAAKGEGFRWPPIVPDNRMRGIWAQRAAQAHLRFGIVIPAERRRFCLTPSIRGQEQ